MFIKSRNVSLNECRPSFSRTVYRANRICDALTDHACCDVYFTAIQRLDVSIKLKSIDIKRSGNYRIETA